MKDLLVDRSLYIDAVEGMNGISRDIEAVLALHAVFLRHRDVPSNISQMIDSRLKDELEAVKDLEILFTNCLQTVQTNIDAVSLVLNLDTLGSTERRPAAAWLRSTQESG